MLTVAICDDDLLIRGQVETLISSVDQKIEIKRYENEKILSDLKLFDIIFMDIEIGNKSGIEFAMEVRKQNPDCIIIFITSYTSYISDAFDAIPFQYLIKPLDENRLIDVYKKALSAIRNRKKYILISWNGETERIECSNVMYIERNQRNVIFHLKDGNLKKSSTKFIDYVSELESFGFVRCRNSTLVNLSYIKALQRTYYVVLNNSEVVSISKKYLLNVREMFAKKISGEIICK